MDYNDKLETLRTEAKDKIIEALDEKGKIVFVEIDEDDDYPDEYYEMPSEYVVGKYDYAPYNIIMIYREGVNYYAHAINTDDSNHIFVFTIHDLGVKSMCMIADLV